MHKPVSTTTCTALSAYGARAQQCSPCCNFRAYQYERAEDAFILGDVDFNLAPETSTRGSNFEGQRLYQKSPLVSGSIATPGAAVRRYLQTFSWRRSRSRDSRYSRKGRGSPRVVHARDANPKATASPTTPPKSFLPFPSQRQSPPRVATWLSAHGTFFRLSNAALMAQYTLVCSLGAAWLRRRAAMTVTVHSSRPTVAHWSICYASSLDVCTTRLRRMRLWTLSYRYSIRANSLQPVLKRNSSLHHI